MNRGEAAAEAKADPVSSEEHEFAEFYRRVTQAEGIAEAEAVAAVRVADRGWQAHVTYLERRFATRWRQQSGIRSAKEARRTGVARAQRDARGTPLILLQNPQPLRQRKSPDFRGFSR